MNYSDMQVVEAGGLEVVPADGLQIVQASGLEVDHRSQSLHELDNGCLDHKSDQPPFATEPRWSRICGRRSVTVITMVAVGLLVVLATILGGILGSRSHTGAPAATTNSSMHIPPQIPPADTHTIRKLSNIAVTGYVDGSVFHKWLFYQGDDDQIRVSTFDSTVGKWGSPQVLAKAQSGSSFTATTFNRTAYFPANPGWQVEFFYLDASNTIQEINFASGTSVITGSLTPLGIKAGTKSGLAAFWPNIFYHDDSANLQEVWWGSNNASSNYWGQVGLFGPAGGFLGPINLMHESGLVVLPSNAANEGTSLFYQRNDGKVQQYTYTLSAHWNPGPTLSTLTSATKLAGFAYPRINSKEANMYILHQAPSGDIMVEWNDDSIGWKGPTTYPALQGADSGTSIACLTTAVLVNAALINNENMYRCYFQVNGAVREVSFANGLWSIVGIVPMV